MSLDAPKSTPGPEGPQSGLGEALLRLARVTQRLRRECPWDREQDERSIVPHTVEEAYELADAAHSGDDAKLLDELGDVLFQVYFLALLLEERESGDLAAVARNVTEKLIRRHPHIFGSDGGNALEGLPTAAQTPAEVRENWDVIKQKEGKDGGIAETLPSLLYARKVQRRAAGGSDRGDSDEVLRALRASLEVAAEAVAAEGPDPEAQERTAHGSEQLYEAIGDLLFATVALARTVQVDPEIALRRSTDGFRTRALDSR